MEKGVNLHQRDSKGRTPLCIATFNGHSSLMLILLSWGAKVNVKDITSYRPRLFKVYYDCDHDYDDGECIPLKRYMDEPKRKLLGALEELEKKYMNSAKPYYTFAEVKDQVLEILDKKDFNDPTVHNAVCGYIINNLQENQRQDAFNFLKDHCMTKYNHALSREGVYRSLPEHYFTSNANRNVMKS